MSIKVVPDLGKPTRNTGLEPESSNLRLAIFEIDLFLRVVKLFPIS